MPNSRCRSAISITSWGWDLQCQYCHTSVEKSSYAGIPPTKTCMNCHAQIWTNAGLLQPVRTSWATGDSIPWVKIHDLPDFVYFNHEIHVNKGIGCSSCHGRVDLMPLMYQQNTLQMEWCLNCHRNPGKNLRPTSEIYNMAWDGPSSQKPVWCGSLGLKDGVPTAQTVSCTTIDPSQAGAQVASLNMLPDGLHAQATSDGPAMVIPAELALREADRPGLAGQIPDPAVPHPHAPGIEQLRDMPPMSETNGKRQELTLEAARAKLAGQTGKTYWRSVDELADTPAFREMVQREFPSQAAEWIDPVSRRGFLKVMGASLALAGLSGCTKQPDEPIYPVRQGAGGPGAWPPGVLCHRDALQYGCSAAAGQERRLPADQGGRQSGPSGQPRLF